MMKKYTADSLFLVETVESGKINKTQLDKFTRNDRIDAIGISNRYVGKLYINPRPAALYNTGYERL